LAPAFGQFLVRECPAVAERLGERFDLDRKCPGCFLGRSRAVVQQHLVVARELCRLDVAAIHGPEAVIWCAPKLLTVGETHTKDRRDTILHYDQRRARNDASTGLFRSRAKSEALTLFALRGHAPTP